MLRVFQKTQRARAWRPSAAQTRTGLGVLAGLTGVALVAALAAMHTERKRVDGEVRAALVGSTTNVAQLERAIKALEASRTSEAAEIVALRVQFDAAIADLSAHRGTVEATMLRAVRAIAPGIDHADTLDGQIAVLGVFATTLKGIDADLTSLLTTSALEIKLEQNNIKKSVIALQYAVRDLTLAANADPAAEPAGAEHIARLTAIEQQVNEMAGAMDTNVAHNAAQFQNTIRNVEDMVLRTAAALKSAIHADADAVRADYDGRTRVVEQALAETQAQLALHGAKKPIIVFDDAAAQVAASVREEVNALRASVKADLATLGRCLQAHIVEASVARDMARLDAAATARDIQLIAGHVYDARLQTQQAIETNALVIENMLGLQESIRQLQWQTGDVVDIPPVTNATVPNEPHGDAAIEPDISGLAQHVATGAGGHDLYGGPDGDRGTLDIDHIDHNESVTITVFGAGGSERGVLAALASAVPFLRPSTQLEILKLLLSRRRKQRPYV